MAGKKRKTPDLHSELLAGSDADQGHKEKLRKYSSAKKHSDSVVSYIVTEKPLLFKEAELLRACSSWLIFRHYYLAKQYRLIGGCTCKKHLLCAMCALRRSAKTVMAYSAKITQVMSENPSLVPVLLTLTVKNGPDLEERTNHLEGSFKRMVNNRNRALHGGRHQTVFRLVHGAAGAFEFKRGSGSGLWHPHIHLFALVDLETDLLEMERKMSEEWLGLTGDSHNVDVTPLDMSTEENALKAVCEVFRYSLKFGEMEICDQVEAYEVLKGRRLVRDFGSLHGVKVPDDLHDTIEDELKLQPYIDMIYEYSSKKGYFLKDTTDTGDMHTGPSRPKKTAEQKKLKKIARNKSLRVKDLEKPWQTVKADVAYVKQWAEQANIEEIKLEEAPF